MERRAQRYRTSSLPYAYRDDGLEFELEWYNVDNKSTRDIDLKAGQTRLPIPPDSHDGDWETVVLGGKITVPEATVESVFPPEERSSPPAKVYVAIQCHQTIYRDRQLVSEGPLSSAGVSEEVEIRLEREDLRGEVELHPYLVRTEPSDFDGKYATESDVRLASGTKYTAIVDSARDEGEAWIDGEETSFSQSAHLPDNDELYYLDFRNEARPKLWINADYPRITDVLQTDGSVGTEPRLRDVILDQISYSVWTQLIVRAGTAVDDRGEVEYQWQETVIEAFAREIYDFDEPGEAALALRDDVRDPESLPELLSRIDRELQEYIDPRTQLINLMEEGLQI